MDQHGTGTVTVPICYQSLPSNYSFPPRKAYHPMKASNGQPMDGYSVRGILKTHWPQKHAKQVGGLWCSAGSKLDLHKPALTNACMHVPRCLGRSHPW